MTVVNFTRRSMFVIPALAMLPLWSCFPNKIHSDNSAQNGVRLSTLQRFIEHLFPIEGVESASFSTVAMAILDNPVLSEPINNAVKSLNDMAEGNWLNAEVAAQTQTMKAQETQPWFVTLFIMSRALLFDLPDVWSILDYEGPSTEFGGYKYRGFDDIDWLPKVAP